MVGKEQKVNLEIQNRDFKYYIFDWDDNILKMPTRIHLERKLPDGTWVPHHVSTVLFALIRNDTEHYRPPHGNWEEAFVEFQDNQDQTESQFLIDTREALQRVARGEVPPGPSFEKMRVTLREGRLFAIVTARGHEPESLRSAVKLFIDVVLNEEEREEMMENLRGYRACFDKITTFGTDEEELAYYLSLNRYHAVTNPNFKRKMIASGFVCPSEARPKQAELAKRFAIRDFVEHVIRIMTRTGADALRKPISVGFSDDDPGNVATVKAYIQQELSKRFPGIKYCVYDTSDPTVPNGQKVVVSGQLDFGF